MAIIKTVDLTKHYGSERGIENINLTVQKGEIFGFIGPNGAGKSTTIRTLMGFMRPSSGSATIFGKDITKHGTAIRQRVGYLPSEVFYYDHMRVRDLLEYSASFYSQPKQAMRARTQELAAALNLELSKKIDDLSYGNKKKVGIVQGLLHQPDLIILDEPTGGLDPLMQQTFFDLLRQENQRGATILFSSHILSEVQKMCDRVAIIKEGLIIATEHMADLRANSYVKCRLESTAAINRQLLTLAGILNLQTSGQSASFLYKGDINKLLTITTKLHLKNLWLEEPDLEEIFMHYYTTQG